MANILKTELKVAATSMLCQGAGIRSIERITGIHRDTIMRLGVRMGERCKTMMDEKLRNLTSRLIQVDEIWGFIAMKQKTAVRKKAGSDVGDIWTRVAIDADTKLVPTFAVGDRTQYMANNFIEDLASRLSHRVQLSSGCFESIRTSGGACVWLQR